MTEPHFFERPKGLSAQEIVALTGAVALGDGFSDRRISGIAMRSCAAIGSRSEVIAQG